MNIKKIEITTRIHLLVFDTQRDAASTFLRFEESYESPKFRGKTFSFDEFKKWYIKNSFKNKGRRNFTYYSDWTAFNIPSYVLRPFYAGKFDPLSAAEKSVLGIFKNEPEPFYIIGVHKQTKNLRSVLDHEIAHGLFYIDRNYRREVIKLLAKFDIKPIKEEIRSGGGYHEETLDDEIQAIIIDEDEKYDELIPSALAKSLKRLYKKYSKINDIQFPTIK